ncbi:hypothetical protein SANTM175S_09089 [Streptomyces antimycoticus]
MRYDGVRMRPVELPLALGWTACRGGRWASGRTRRCDDQGVMTTAVEMVGRLQRAVSDAVDVGWEGFSHDGDTHTGVVGVRRVAPADDVHVSRRRTSYERWLSRSEGAACVAGGLAGGLAPLSAFALPGRRSGPRRRSRRNPRRHEHRRSMSDRSLRRETVAGVNILFGRRGIRRVTNPSPCRGRRVCRLRGCAPTRDRAPGRPGQGQKSGVSGPMRLRTAVCTSASSAGSAASRRSCSTTRVSAVAAWRAASSRVLSLAVPQAFDGEARREGRIGGGQRAGGAAAQVGGGRLAVDMAQYGRGAGDRQASGAVDERPQDLGVRALGPDRAAEGGEHERGVVLTAAAGEHRGRRVTESVGAVGPRRGPGRGRRYCACVRRRRGPPGRPAPRRPARSRPPRSGRAPRGLRSPRGHAAAPRRGRRRGPTRRRRGVRAGPRDRRRRPGGSGPPRRGGGHPASDQCSR